MWRQNLIHRQPLCQQMRQGPESCASDNIMCKRICCKKCWCLGISASLWKQTITELIKNLKTCVIFSYIVYRFKKYLPPRKAIYGSPSASASSLVCCPSSAECVFSCLCSLCADLFHNSFQILPPPQPRPNASNAERCLFSLRLDKQFSSSRPCIQPQFCMLLSR